MKSQVATRIAWATVVIGVTLTWAKQAEAQRRYGKTPPGGFRQAQFDQMLPEVDLPSPARESDSLPLMDDVIPPSAVTPSPFESTTSETSPRTDEFFESPESVDESEVLDSGSLPFEAPMSEGEYLLNYDSTFNEDAAPVYSTGTWFRRGNWYSDMSVMVLTRTKPRPENVFLEGGTRIFSNNNLLLPKYTTGFQLSLGRFMGRDVAGRDHQTEVRFMGGFDWSDSTLVVSNIPNNVSFVEVSPNTQDVNAAGLLNNNEMGYLTSGDFNSIEFNYKISTRPGGDQMAMQPNGEWVRHGVGSSLRSILAGFRVMSWRELVNINGVNVTEDRFSLYNVRTHNDMFGVQLGGEMTEKYDAWTFGLSAKVVGALNFADRLDIVSTAPSFAQLDSSVDSVVSAEKVTFLADIGVSGSYQVRPNLHLRASYNFLLLAGVARASEQLSLLNGFEQLNVGGTAFMNGGSLGFETSW